ncbi:MAG: prolyl oligopeptidase family serine peptidase [Bacteroidota bacterium]
MKKLPFVLASLLTGICFGFSTQVIGQNSFSLEEVMSNSFPSSLVGDAHNQRVAWVFNERGIRNIWVAEAPDYVGKPLTQFTEDDGQEISNLQFSQDGTRILFIRGGAPNRQGEIPNPLNSVQLADRSIWQVFFKGGDPEKLLEAGNYTLHPSQNVIAYAKGKSVFSFDIDTQKEPRKLFTGRGSPRTLRWSPNTQNPSLAFVSTRGDHSFIGVYHPDSTRILYLNPSVDLDQWPVWSPDGKEIAFIRFPYEKPQIFVPRREASPWSIWIATVNTGAAKKIWTAEPGKGSAFRSISSQSQLFWGNDDQLVFPYEKSGWTQMYKVSAQNGMLSILTPGEFEVQYVTLSPDRKTILYSSNQEDIDRQHIWKVPVTGGKPEQLTKGEGVEWAPVSLGEAGPLFCLASSYNLPAHPVQIESSGNKRNLAPKAIPASFPIEELVQPQQVVFPSTDGMQIHGQLFLPTSQAGKHPAVLFFHGGSRRQMLLGFHHRGYYHNAFALNQYLASKGYVVLSVNYRSGIGYGLDFREALNYGAGGVSEFQDVVGAALYLRNRPEVDPERIGLWGGSYGGYLTALGLARASDLFQAGVDIHGVHDWNPVISNFIPSYNPLENPEFARKAYESSPMAFVDGWRSPVLLIHGDDDRNVPFSESVDLANALRKQGVYFEQLVFPDEVHGFLLHSNWMKAYEATVDFFDRMLKEK